MARKFINQTTFTKNELDKFLIDDSSCIECITHKIHLTFPPHGFSDIKKTIRSTLNLTKIGLYDAELDGIILAYRNLKILNNLWEIRYDSPGLHVNIQGEFYVFKPKIGITLEGIVQRITKMYIGVIIYRVFTAAIRLDDKTDRYEIESDKPIKFKIKDFDLKNRLPFIEGELIPFNNNIGKAGKSSVNKKIIFSDEDNFDSGISTGDQNTSINIETESMYLFIICLSHKKISFIIYKQITYKLFCLQ